MVRPNPVAILRVPVVSSCMYTRYFGSSLEMYGIFMSAFVYPIVTDIVVVDTLEN